jgi:haloalkane dehalogenase
MVIPDGLASGVADPMKVLRTPDSRFAALAGFPFVPRYLEIVADDGTPLRLAYVEEGPRDAAPVLLLHGEPSWSYLYRSMIPPLVAAGRRVIAPDLIGFGRSDKPADVKDYSYAAHLAWLQAFVDRLALERITLFCQDWGGLLGLRLVAAAPGRFARVVASNTGLPTGDQPMPAAFLKWRDYSQNVPVFDAGTIVDRGTCRGIDAAARAGYNAPFPDESYCAGARKFPLLVPNTPADPEAPANRAAWRQLEKFDRPFLTAFGDSDQITAGADRLMQARIPGARGQPHVLLPAGGHFIQEDHGPRLAELLTGFIAAGP